MCRLRLALGLLLTIGCASGRGAPEVADLPAEEAAAPYSNKGCQRAATVTVHVDNRGSPDVQIAFGSYSPARVALGLSRTTYRVPRYHLTGAIRLRIARGGLQIGTPWPIATEPVLCNDATLIIGSGIRYSFFYGDKLGYLDRDGGDEETADGECKATIRVRVPEGTGTVYLAGNLPQLGPWHPDGLAMSGEGRERVAEVEAPAGTAFEYKFTLGTWHREALPPSGTVPENHRLLINGEVEATHDIAAFKRDPKEYFADWEASGVRGRLVYWTDVGSAHLERPRHVEIWLPPGYDEDPVRRYPVLYMHDGQNLFDPRIANTGVDWGVDEAVVRLVEAGAIPPIIVVGAWSTADRMPEYSPWHGAPDYARFLIEELMPRIDGEFRTLTGPAHTAVSGSSMGGLLSFYLVTRHSEVFGACACVSTHFPLSEVTVARRFPGGVGAASPDSTPYIVRDIEAGLTVPEGTRYWFDYGTEGLDAGYGPTHEAVRGWLLSQGLTEGEDFVIRRHAGADHNEAAWRARLADALTFLFGEERE